MKEKLINLGLTEEQAQKVVDNFGTVIDGLYVTKERFNEVNNELTTTKKTLSDRDKQIADLKNDENSNEELKKKITELENSNKAAAKEAEKKLAAERKSNAIKLELIGKVHNADVTMNLLNMDNIVMDDNGKVKSGLKEQLDDLKKSDSYLFIPENNNNGNNNININNNVVKGATPKDGDAGTPSNLSKAEMFAKSLASKANENAKATADSVYFGNN